MKYFTPAWHSGAIDSVGPDTAFEDYRRYLAPLLPGLPPDVQTLAGISLHDGLLFHLAAEADSLEMTLRCGDLQVGYFDLALNYFGVIHSADLAETLTKLAPIPSRQAARQIARYSEAMYDEIDVDGDWIIHRILFLLHDNHHELTVRFKDLALSTQKSLNRYNTENDDIYPVDVKHL